LIFDQENEFTFTKDPYQFFTEETLKNCNLEIFKVSSPIEGNFNLINEFPNILLSEIPSLIDIFIIY